MTRRKSGGGPTAALGTNRTNRAGLTMSVDRDQPEVAFRGRQDRFRPGTEMVSDVRSPTTQPSGTPAMRIPS
jgi:hypothetical protein